MTITQEDLKEFHKLARLGLSRLDRLEKHKKRERVVKKGEERKTHFETIHDVRKWMEQMPSGPECK